jgi:hypothetical protein
MSSIVRFHPGITLAIALAIVLAMAPGRVRALENGHFVINPATGFAANGHDPVAYFVDRTLREGKPDHEVLWGEVAWRFANEGNREAFLLDPLVYAPSYGGHCPVALSRGYPAEGDPRLWAIFDDRLYFFYSEKNMQEFATAPASIVSEAHDTWDRLFPF